MRPSCSHHPWALYGSWVHMTLMLTLPPMRSLSGRSPTRLWAGLQFNGNVRAPVWFQRGRDVVIPQLLLLRGGGSHADQPSCEQMAKTSPYSMLAKPQPAPDPASSHAVASATIATCAASRAASTAIPPQPMHRRGRQLRL